MKFIRRFLALVFLCILCAVGFVGYQGYERYQAALGTESLEDKTEAIRNNASYTELSNLPQIYQDAVVAVEDKRFYSHPGVDIISICRAIKNDIQAGKLIEGGSTITQQLAKNMYFDQERSITRKVAEGFMALKLEKTYSKEEILELYVNSIYFGNGYYSIAEASNGYYGKEPAQMNEYESTMLAGTPNAPSAYAPNVNPELAASRQMKVLQSMVKQEYITQEQADSIIAMGGGI